ncbi:MAG: GTPase Era [Bacteroidetes bacterium]|nr:GTPase Era [Bacteroidota bacterium]
MSQVPHRAGFVALLGKPNVGKSTLLNALAGEKLAIVTPKAQTTRHRILGIVSTDDWQIIFSDTPGLIAPRYELHKSMMQSAGSALQDADALVLMAHPEEIFDETPVRELLALHPDIPRILVINKCDAYPADKVQARIEELQWVKPRATCVISALRQIGLSELLDTLVAILPESPPFYDKDQLTDRPMRFFAAETIREKVFLFLRQEIPYHTEVTILFYKDAEGDDPVHIEAEIHVARQTQKAMVIGKQGAMIKKIGTAARKEIAHMLGQPVRLELYVRVAEDWKDRPEWLRRFGYE